MFSFYKSFDAKKPAWNTNLNPAGASPGLNFYTQNGNSRLFISEDTGNIGIGNAALKKVPGMIGPFLQIGSDAEGASSGQLILSKHVPNGGTRSFKMGLDENCDFTLGDFGNSGDLKYTPALTIGWSKQEVTIPKSLFIKGKAVAEQGINLKDAGAIRLIADGDDDMSNGIADLGLYSTIKDRWIRIAANQGPIKFFNNKQDEVEYGVFPSLLIDKNRNVGVGTDDILNAGTGPVLQIGSDVRGDSIGELILSRGNTGSRSFKMGLDADFNFSIGDFGTSVVSPRVYSPGLLINYNSRNVTIPNKLNVGSGLSLTGDGKIVFRASADNSISLVGCFDLGLYSTIEKHNMRFAVNQAAIAFFNNKSGDTIGAGKVSLLIDVNGNVGVGNGTSFEVIKSGTDPVLQIGNDNEGDNSGQLILTKHKTDGATRSFKVGLDENFAFSIGDYGNSEGTRIYTPALTIDWNKRNVNVPQSLIVKGKVSGGNGINLKNNGGIRFVAATEDDGVSGHTDLGLYSTIKERWIRIAARQAPIAFFNTKEDEAEYGGATMSMIIDVNRNVGIGTNEVYKKNSADVGPILQIGNDNKTVSSGQLLLSKYNGSLSRTYGMMVNDAYHFSIGDCGYNGQPSRTYNAAIVIASNSNDVTIEKSLIVKGTFPTASDIRIKKDIVSCDGSASLNILKSLNIADYRHIDPLNFGDKLVKGLIAQQVETIFPEAVVTRKDFVPGILSAPISVIEEDGVVSFSMAQPHLLSDGDVVKIHTQAGDKEQTITIIDDNSFSVQGTAEEYQNDVVIYGKQVDDFKSIEYNRIFLLNLSATQQLAKENEELKNQLSDVVSRLDRYLAGLKS